MSNLTPPSKPRPDFPLFADKASKQWRKDVWQRDPETGKKRSFPYYFGRWDKDMDGSKALAEWVRRKDAILAGLDRQQRQGKEMVGNGPTVETAFRAFIDYAQKRMDANDMSAESFRDYKSRLETFLQYVGQNVLFSALNPRHFDGFMEKCKKTVWEDGPRKGKPRYGPHALAGFVRAIKAASRVIIQLFPGLAEPTYGVNFVEPPTDKEALRMLAMREGKMPTPDVVLTPRMVRWLMRNAQPWLRAAILLGVNCGLGPSDLSRLCWEHINFDTGRLYFPRGKTGLIRESYVWKITRKALQGLPRHGARIFDNRAGKPLVEKVIKRQGDKVVKVRVNSRISNPWWVLVKRGRAAGVLPAEGKLGFYRLRHRCYTVAENHHDLNMVHRLMGHRLIGQGNAYKDDIMPMRRLKRLAMYIFPRVLGRRKPKASTNPQLRIVGGDGGHAANQSAAQQPAAKSA